jgi:hypothetical protein
MRELRLFPDALPLSFDPGLLLLRESVPPHLATFSALGLATLSVRKCVLKWHSSLLIF